MDLQQQIDDLATRLRRLEDEAAIQRLILSYGPAADCGLTALAASVWADDGVYDWDADGEPYRGSTAVDTMLQGGGHQGLIGKGAAHFAGPPLIEIDGDTAIAVNYSLVVLRGAEQFKLWRVSAARWDLERTDSGWRVSRRTNRLLDSSGAGRAAVHRGAERALPGRQEVSTGKPRLAVATPIVTTLPGASARWEQTATIDDLALIAETADRLGYHDLTCSEHIGVPAEQAERRGARYWDPLATFGYLAARTRQIRFTTLVLVLGYHHPLEIAKRYGTLDLISGGRLILGVGVGTLKEEFDLLGVPFEDRGARGDDALKALRASLGVREPAYHGDFYAFDSLIVDPCALQPQVPIWVGGRTLRSLRRAITLADGWCPFAVTLTQAAEWLRQVDVPDGFEVRLGPSRPFDPIAEPAATQDALANLAAAGATIISANFVHHSLQHYLEQLEALAAVQEETLEGRAS